MHMLNADLFDEKDKKIYQLSKIVEAYKKYDEEQKAYRHSLERENQDLRYRVEDLEAEMSEITDDSGIEELKKRYNKLIAESEKRLKEYTDLRNVYNRKIALLSIPGDLQKAIDELSDDQTKLLLNIASSKKQIKKLKARERRNRNMFYTFMSSFITKGHVDQEKIEELIEWLKKEHDTESE